MNGCGSEDAPQQRHTNCKRKAARYFTVYIFNMFIRIEVNVAVGVFITVPMYLTLMHILAQSCIVFQHHQVETQLPAHKASLQTSDGWCRIWMSRSPSPYLKLCVNEFAPGCSPNIQEIRADAVPTLNTCKHTRYTALSRLNKMRSIKTQGFCQSKSVALVIV